MTNQRKSIKKEDKHAKKLEKSKSIDKEPKEDKPKEDKPKDEKPKEEKPKESPKESPKEPPKESPKEKEKKDEVPKDDLKAKGKVESGETLGTSLRRVESEKSKDLTGFPKSVANKDTLIIEEAVDDIVLRMSSSIPTGKHSKMFKSYDDVFPGNKAVEWLISQKISTTKEEAAEALTFLADCGALEDAEKNLVLNLAIYISFVA